MSQPYTFDRVVRLLVNILFLAGFVWLMKVLGDVLIPFAVAFLLAYLLNPLVNLTQKKVPHRGGAIALVLGGLSLVVVLLLLWLVPRIGHEVGHMGTLLGQFVEDKNFVTRAQEYLPEGAVQQALTTLKNAGVDETSRGKLITIMQNQDLWPVVHKAIQKMVPVGWGVVTGTFSVLAFFLGLFVIFLYLVFLLLDYDRVIKEWESFIPSKYREGTLAFIKDFDQSMNRYFRAQAIIAGTVGIFCAVGFSIIGLPMAILLGLFMGLLNMVPYLQLVGLLPAAVLSLILALDSGSSFWVIGGQVLLVIVLAQVLQDAFLTPKIMGDLTGLSPAMLLLSLSVWGKLLGFFGLVIAIPITCLALAYYHRFVQQYEKMT